MTPTSAPRSSLRPLRAVLTLAARDLSLLWNAPATYVIAVVFLLLTSWLFMGPLFKANQSSLQTFLGPMPLIFTFLIPALTMRFFAEEFREGTIEYLGTLPLEDWQIVVAKYLAALGMIVALLAFTLAYPVLLFVIGRPDPGEMIGAYLGLLGLASFFAAIGLWASAMTRNQVVSFVIGFFVCFVFFLIDRFADLFPATLATFVSAFGVNSHFESLARGVLDTRDILYWLGGTVFFLAACATAVQSRRWR